MSEYECRRCGEPWEQEETPFYNEGKCANCGASAGNNKIEKDKENPLLRQGDDSGN